MSILRENIPLAVVTAVLVIAIIVLYREVASIKSTLTQCPPQLDFNIASIVPPSPHATEISEGPLEVVDAVEVPVLKPALKKRSSVPKSNAMGSIDEES
jgi:hypothetical protein